MAASFVSHKVQDLNSTLIAMVQDIMQGWGELELHHLYQKPEWSAFLQYLAHTYRQIGDPEAFASEIEQVLRGTLGFQSLRRINPRWALRFVDSVRAYGHRIAGKPLTLVDSTGWSWESVNDALIRLSRERITADVWDPRDLFRGDSQNLRRLMGILLDVPELRENLRKATGGLHPDGAKLARMVSDWVNGATLPEMAQEYFTADDPTTALTDCCRNVYGKLSQTASWGLAALQAMTFGEAFERLSGEEQQTRRNLPARVFYGVGTDEAIAMRLLGAPRGAAEPLARALGRSVRITPLSQLRSTLLEEDGRLWSQALGSSGQDYYRIWRILEGPD